MNDFHDLDPVGYAALRYKAIGRVEAEKTLVYIDSNAFASIGPGFLLHSLGPVAERDAVFRTLGFRFDDSSISREQRSIEKGYKKELEQVFFQKYPGRREDDPNFLAIVD